MSETNPFTALVRKDSSFLSDALENIFGFTLNPQRAADLLYLEEVHKIHEKTELDLSILHYALFERLLCDKESELFLNKHNSHVRQTNVVKYLYRCSRNLDAEKGHLRAQEENQIRDEIIQNIVLAILQPDIYLGQDVPQDTFNLLKADLPNAVDFFSNIISVLQKQDSSNENARKFIESINSKFVRNVESSDLQSLDLSIIKYTEGVSRHESIRELFIDSCFSQVTSPGSDFTKSPIGSLLNVSVLPKFPGSPHLFFTESFDQLGNVGILEESLWRYTNVITGHIHTFIRSALKCQNAKEKVLFWLADCLNKNVNRRKLWNTEFPELNPPMDTNVADGFMVNLTNVLLRLCEPFCNDLKILKVDPTYCAVPNEKRREKGVSMLNMSTETCFLPVESNDGSEEERPMADHYNFITECFYITHRAIELGYCVVIDKLTRKHHDLIQSHRIFEDALQQADPDNVEMFKSRLSRINSQFLSMKCALTDPVLMKGMFDLMSATAFWLCQVALHNDFKDTTTYAPLEEFKLKFPLPDEVPKTLKCIPEFIVENIVSFLVFVRRFSPNSFEVQSIDTLNPIVSFLLVYMGSQRHMTNPHLRASLAEGLESLLPHYTTDLLRDNVPTAQRERLFLEHPHRLQIANNLMEVFVGIETTGQVAFEQKFKYRRPMYTIFVFLWDSPDQVECFRSAAEEAERNMEATNPPLFLKFTNLLINDSIFLLDEGLANMAKLREMENEDWTNLSVTERAQNMSAMRHLESIAKFDNLLGKYTISTLEKLTSKISTVFTHSTMIDRIASMLNYFLLNLVGPKKKNFKVKDPLKHYFNPCETVQKICKIYVNLKDSDAFCMAVSRDGRSYSPVLFELAEEVLVRVKAGNLIGELKEVADMVALKAKKHQAKEEVMAEAPEHFLDPIMSTVMLDPVILPSSRQTVDRSTIARHLLSDQTDPFNRSALSMDQVIPNTELAEEINKWKQERNVS